MDFREFLPGIFFEAGFPFIEVDDREDRTDGLFEFGPVERHGDAHSWT